MNDDAAAIGLRERQAQQVREAVLEATLAALEARAADEISMAEIAQASGVSLRTLYRYFPDRAGLLEAAGEQLYGSLGVPTRIASPQDIAKSFREAGRRLATRPRLTRALVQTQAGRAARSGRRAEREAAIRTALQPLTQTLDPKFAQRATSIIAHLCSAAAWVAVADESGLPDAEAQAAVAWAIETLVGALETAASPSAE